MAHVLPGQLSCPNCGAPAAAKAKACADCGCRFVEDSSPAPRTRAPTRANRRRLGAVALVAAVGSMAFIATRGDRKPGDPSLDGRSTARADRARSRLLSSHPLSARAAERRLEARFTSLRDDDTAAARCSTLEPRPAHAIRRCRIRYPSGIKRTVFVLTNPQGRELLVEP